MRILFIQPSRLNPDGSVFHAKSRWLVGMTLPYLAALTPREHAVEIKDDLRDPIDIDAPVDLVALTFMSHQARRAYQIAEGFRKRKRAVVLGGFHVTLAPEEALEHCDAIVFGEAELVWKQLLEDFGAGRLQKRYLASALSDLKGLPVPRYDLLDLKRYQIANIPTQTTRGCPYGCNYCEVSTVYGRKFRHRPPEEVEEEIRTIQRTTGRRAFYLVDDIFNADRKHAFEVMERILPLKIVWSCLCTANIGSDLEFLDLMRKSGCSHINIGMETINAENLKLINKKQNHTDRYGKQFAEIRKRGIEYSLNVIFGLDGDTKDTFDATLALLKEYKAPMAFAFILAPRVGLEIRKQLQDQNRILTDDWTRYTSYECVFQPKNMTPLELEDGFWRFQREFYSLPSIFRRLFTPPKSYTPRALAANLFFKYGARRRIHPLTYY